MITFNDKVVTVSNGKWINNVNYNPLNLPSYTIRLKYKEGVTPSFSKGTATRVSQNPNVWDLRYVSTNWQGLLVTNKADLIEVLGANSKNVNNMNTLFAGCENLQRVALFDTSNVTGMHGMFFNCASLTSIPHYDTSKATTMQDMFYGCTSLITIPYFNTSKVTNMYQMFYECSSLNSVPAIDTSKVTSMSSMFEGCSSLTTVPLLNTSKVTIMARMFANCTSLEYIPLFDTSKATDVHNMFNGCTSLKNVPLFDTSSVDPTTSTFGMMGMFWNCYSVESGALALYQQASTQANPPGNHSYTFTNCGRDTITGAAELAQIPANWGGTAP